MESWDVVLIVSLTLNAAVLGGWMYRRIRRGLFLLYVQALRTERDPLVTPIPEVDDEFD